MIKTKITGLSILAIAFLAMTSSGVKANEAMMRCLEKKDPTKLETQECVDYIDKSPGAFMHDWTIMPGFSSADLAASGYTLMNVQQVNFKGLEGLLFLTFWKHPNNSDVTICRSIILPLGKQLTRRDNSGHGEECFFTMPYKSRLPDTATNK